MHIEPPLFADVVLNTNERYACSPTQPPPQWRGVVIEAPSRVSFKAGETAGRYGAFAAIPICGFFFVDANFASADQPMTLVAVDRQTGRSYSGAIVELDPSPEEPPPGQDSFTPEELLGVGSGGYFNPNLADFVAIPAKAAVYEVHVELRDYKSNVVVVEIAEQP